MLCLRVGTGKRLTINSGNAILFLERIRTFAVLAPDCTTPPIVPLLQLHMQNVQRVHLLAAALGGPGIDDVGAGGLPADAAGGAFDSEK